MVLCRIASTIPAMGVTAVTAQTRINRSSRLVLYLVRQIQQLRDHDDQQNRQVPVSAQQSFHELLFSTVRRDTGGDAQAQLQLIRWRCGAAV